jgi:hypothetical protein
MQEGQRSFLQEIAGSPGAGNRPGLPQIRTCAFRAYGSSRHGFAYGRHTEGTSTGGGTGNHCNSRAKETPELAARHERRAS